MLNFRMDLPRRVLIAWLQPPYFEAGSCRARIFAGATLRAVSGILIGFIRESLRHSHRWRHPRPWVIVACSMRFLMEAYSDREDRAIMPMLADIGVQLEHLVDIANSLAES